MSSHEPSGSDVLRAVLSTARDSFAARGIELPDPVVDGGGPSSTFTAAVFAGELLGLPTWGAHVAVRIPDAIYDLGRPGLIGPHLGVFRQVFFSLPESSLGGLDPETLTRSLMDDIDRRLLGSNEALLFRAYDWNANSTRMKGVAKEVNLATGILKGMEIAQLNRIEQVGGVKLKEPCYLIVIGVDRLTYCLSLKEHFQGAEECTSVADFYRTTPEHADSLERLHHNILFAEQLQPGLKRQFDEELERLENDLADVGPVDEATMQRFRSINVVLETLFMSRRISGGLRQGYIGRIGDVAKLIARAMLAHPERSSILAAEKQLAPNDDMVRQVDQLLLQSTRAAGDFVEQAAPGVMPVETLPKKVETWHVDTIVTSVNQDLLDSMPEEQCKALGELISTGMKDIGKAVRANHSELPAGFAAVKESEQRPILAMDLSVTPAQSLNHLDTMDLVGVTGRKRRERQEKLFSLLQAEGMEVPLAAGQVLPYMGIDDLFCSARIFDRSVAALVDAWFERHLPQLRETFHALKQNTPPEAPAMQYCWAALRVELIARYLLLRAAAGKPLWQDPYGARHLINRRVLPLWQKSPPPESLRRRLIETSVQDVAVPPEAAETVKDYLLGKLLEA